MNSSLLRPRNPRPAAKVADGDVANDASTTADKKQKHATALLRAFVDKVTQQVLQLQSQRQQIVAPRLRNNNNMIVTGILMLVILLLWFDADDGTTPTSNLLIDVMDAACHGKERLLELLRDSGTEAALQQQRTQQLDDDGVEQATISIKTYCPRLPMFQTIEELYGAQPVFIRNGCREKRNASDNAASPQLTPLEPRVAGLYNSGTSLLIKLLQVNLPSLGRSKLYQRYLRNETRTVYDWDVPYGKHMHLRYRDQGVLNPGQEGAFNSTNSTYLAVVVVKDPFLWMQSMCHNRYGVKWPHKPDKHCPNIVPDEALGDPPSAVDAGKRYGQVPVLVKAQVGKQQYMDQYASLLDLYWEWYQAYWEDTKQPHILVRYEDLILHGPSVMQAIATCAGRNERITQTMFRFYIPKTMGSHSIESMGYLAALFRYANYSTHAANNMTQEDLARADQIYSKYDHMRDALHYPPSPLRKPSQRHEEDQ